MSLLLMPPKNLFGFNVYWAKSESFKSYYPIHIWYQSQIPIPGTDVVGYHHICEDWYLIPSHRKFNYIGQYLVKSS
jgi:hypothetical protein